MNDRLERFGEFLANLQTSIFTTSFQQVGSNWAHTNIKHEFDLLYYIVAGQCRIRANNEDLYPRAGQLVLIPAGTTITTSSDDDQFAKYYCHFTASIGETRLNELLRLSLIIDVEDCSLIEQHFQQLLRHSSQHAMTSALRCKAILYEILCYYIENSPVKTLHDTGHTSIETISVVINFIESHLSDKLSVEKLAGLVHFHPRYFIEVFKTMMGCPPMQYITKLRFERARIMLATTTWSIHEIADKVGIVPEYFTKFFKHHSGISPSVYRNHVTGPSSKI